MKHNFNKYYFERNLPHIQPAGGQFFVTFRLYGTLPLSISQLLEEEYTINRNKIIAINYQDYQRQIYNEQKGLSHGLIHTWIVPKQEVYIYNKAKLLK